MKTKKEKLKTEKKIVHLPLLEEVSFFSIRGYIVAVFMALVAALIPPLMFEFSIHTFFSKFGILFILYYVILSIVCYRLILFVIRVNYSKHLQKISEATRRVAKGDFSVEIELDRNIKDNSYINIMFRDFNTMVAELNSIESLKNDFISNVSHEIKTPLAIINNYTTALKDEALPQSIREEYIETVIESTEKLSALVSNILKLSKIENGKISPERRQYDLCRQLSEVALSFEDVWEEKNIKFFVEMEDRVIINENYAFLDLIWHNLLSNAFKFTENGGTVSLLQTSDEGFVMVTVKDTGCGFDEETQKHIFDKFYQGETSHTEEGNGLGLALVQKIAERNDYKIEVHSEFGKGTEFTIKIKKDL